MKLVAYLTSAVWWRAGLFTLRGSQLKVCNYSCGILLDGDLCPYIVHSLAGPLPSPENVTLISQNFSPTQLHWNPPYYTMMTSAGRDLKELNIRHNQGQPVANFNISLPQSVDVCTLHVRISAENSAGMSAPSEAFGVGKL